MAEHGVVFIIMDDCYDIAQTILCLCIVRMYVVDVVLYNVIYLRN